MWIGESFVGSGANVAHINVFVGPKDGPVGAAQVANMSQPRLGYIPFMAVLRPNLPAKPATLFANKVDLQGEQHEKMTFGPAQAGVARGVQEAYEAGSLPDEAFDEWAVIACVYVTAEADDADAVYENNHQATLEAIERAMNNQPSREELREVMASPSNPFYTPST